MGIFDFFRKKPTKADAIPSTREYIPADEWTGYLPLKKDYAKLEQRPSDKGKGHPEIHIHIMNIKGWLRGIHHHCSKEHLQGYLDEYHFRFNRRNNMDTIFDVLLRRMINYKLTR